MLYKDHNTGENSIRNAEN